MNTHDRIDAQIAIARELDLGILETWNTMELAGDVVNALELAGFDIQKRAEQCGHLDTHNGIVMRCERTDHTDDNHHLVATPFLSVVQ